VVNYSTGTKINGLEPGLLSDSDAGNVDEEFGSVEESTDDDSEGDDGAFSGDRAKAAAAAATAAGATAAGAATAAAAAAASARFKGMWSKTKRQMEYAYDNIT
jgi:hypothetical protein